MTENQKRFRDMKKISIGIHFDSEAQRLAATLSSLHANSSRDAEVLVFADGTPEIPYSFHVPDVKFFRESSDPLRRGAAACFNRLAAYSDADILVLLESGARVGSRWLEYLLRALDADPRNGLAGP